ncbi:MAG: MBL fold metallo-hydrolase [Patescibacteria group bacterium]
MLKLSFHGGTQEVTGANYLLETEHTRILVDCGMFQCPRFCAAKNKEEFAYDPKTIDALFVTHAHIDHVGRVPKLARAGFTGKIYSTPPTKDFAALMLEDSLGVLEKEATREGESGAFYDMEDLKHALEMWDTVPYYETFHVGDFEVKFFNAAHILGSAMVEIKVQGKTFLFTGDLGNVPMPLLPPTDHVANVDYLTIESAYGNRVHEDRGERKEKFERAIEDTIKRGGTLMIPAFALERTQEILVDLNELIEHGRVTSVPVFLDSPLSIKATAVYRKYTSYFSDDTKKLIREGDDIFNFPLLQRTLTSDESKNINTVKGPKIILAGAGMMTGGRILHHARRYLPQKENTILFIGYAAAGSIARQIIEKASSVRIFGEEVPVRCDVRSIRGYSAHADSNDLLAFIESNRDTLKQVFVVQGDAAASLFLVQRARDYLGVNAGAPHFGDSVSF